MANKEANNARTAGDILVWTAPEFGGSDTPVVFRYTCPVDDHPVVSAVQLGYLGYAGTVVDSTPTCPLHDVTLEGWSVKQL